MRFRKRIGGWKERLQLATESALYGSAELYGQFVGVAIRTMGYLLDNAPLSVMVTPSPRGDVIVLEDDDDDDDDEGDWGLPPGVNPDHN